LVDLKTGELKIPECILIDPSAFSPDSIKKGCLAWSLIDEFDKLGLSAPLIAGSKDMNNGIIATKRLLKPNLRGIPSLFVTSNCYNWRREITHYCWDNWRRNTLIIRGDKQKPVDKDDHQMENTRRLALFCWPYLDIESKVYDIDSIENRPLTRTRYDTLRQGRSAITGY
jgi:hypothetical protein